MRVFSAVAAQAAILGYSNPQILNPEISILKSSIPEI
jgi:hypothetical protein